MFSFYVCKEKEQLTSSLSSTQRGGKVMTQNRLSVWYLVLKNPPSLTDRTWQWQSHLAPPTPQRLAETTEALRGNISHNLGEQHRKLMPVSSHKAKWTLGAWGACSRSRHLGTCPVERANPDYLGVALTLSFPLNSIIWLCLSSYTIGFSGVMTKLFLFFLPLLTVTQQEKSHAFITISGPKVSNIRDILWDVLLERCFPGHGGRCL